jgi:F-type H+-transporting ATPase subunit b
MDALGFNLAQLIAQIINFGILFAILAFWGFPAINKMLNERSKKIKESLEQAEQVKAQAASAEEELKKQIETGRKEGQEIVARAMHSGEELVQKAQEQAKQEGAALLARAKADISRERDQAIVELRQEFADLTITAAEKVIDRSLDKEAHRQLIDKVLKDSQPKQG